MYWLDDDLKFRVHLKENQLLKYLNKGSAHTKAFFKAIPNGVISRLASLTSMTPGNADTRLDVLYPDHASALTRAGLVLNDEFPTLREALNSIQSQSTTKLSEIGLPVSSNDAKAKKRKEKKLEKSGSASATAKSGDTNRSTSASKD